MTVHKAREHHSTERRMLNRHHKLSQGNEERSYAKQAKRPRKLAPGA